MEPLNQELNPDTKQGAKDLLKELYGTDYINPDILEPDPHGRYVWLAIDTKKKKAMVVYLADFDAEEIPFKGINYHKYLK